MEKTVRGENTIMKHWFNDRNKGQWVCSCGMRFWEKELFLNHLKVSENYTMTKKNWVGDWIRACESPAGQLFAVAVKGVEEEKKEEKKQ